MVASFGVPKSQKGRRIMAEREPQLVENAKKSLSIKGSKTSDALVKFMKDLSDLRKPFSTQLKKKNPIHPFEDDTFLEKFCEKYDSSMFNFISHTKKRPNNLVLGRMFDFHVLDMVEFGVENFKSMADFKNGKVPVGSKPVITFAGEAFNSDPTMQRVKNVLTDYLRLEDAEQLSLQHVQLSITFTHVADTIHMRVYKVNLKKSGCHTPYAELVEIGPRADLVLRRHKLATDDLFKLATRQPDATRVKAVKNVNRDVFGSQLGRIHVGKQKLDGLQTRKMVGLKKPCRRSKKTKDNSNSTPMGQ